ncbi:hypothetical protein D3C81_1504240 [compost metagenome]
MDLQQIKGIRPHSFQTPLNLRFGAGIIPLGRFGGQEEFLPAVGDGLSDNFFAIPVSRRGIHIIDAQVQSLIQCGMCLFIRHAGEIHSSEAQSRYIPAGRAQFTVSHQHALLAYLLVTTNRIVSS